MTVSKLMAVDGSSATEETLSENVSGRKKKKSSSQTALAKGDKKRA